MSETVDNRVVRMEFDNAKFERRIGQTIKSLGQLKESLEFQNTSLSSMGDDLDHIARRFSNFGIVGMTVIQNLTNKVITLGEKIVSSLTIDNVTAGWEKYADKTTAVQTVMAATANQFQNEAEQMAYVNEQLEKLNWYTDETSYNFVDMVGNIGKFTSAGVKLDDAVTAMMGIANWAAVSGQNASTASRAMYQLSQAMGTGTVKMQDWRSIENANMATVEFKKTVLDTAAAMGTLTKVSDDLYYTINGNAVSVTNFTSSLTSDLWFTSDVLVKTLGKYGDFTNTLYDLSQEEENLNKTTSQIIDSIRESGVAVDEFGLKAFRTAQEAKTFGEALDSVKDAASTSWMNIFETIFGDYKSAKVLWTDLANYLYDVFVTPIANVNDLLTEWVAKGGRDAFIEALESIGPAIDGLIAPIRDAFNSVFEGLTGDKLVTVTTKFRDFIQSIKYTENEVSALEIVFKNIFKALQLILEIGKKVLTLAETALKFIGKYVGIILDFISKIIVKVDSLATKLKDAVSSSSVIQKISDYADNIKESFNDATQSIGDFLTGVNRTEKSESIFKRIFSGIGSTIQNLTNKIKSIKVQDILDKILESLMKAVNFVDSKTERARAFLEKTILSLTGLEVKLPTLAGIIDKVKKAFGFLALEIQKVQTGMAEFGSTAWSLIKTVFGAGISKVKQFGTNLQKVITYVSNSIQPIKTITKFLVDSFKMVGNMATDFIVTIFSGLTGEDFTSFGDTIKGVFGSIENVILNFVTGIKAVISDIVGIISSGNLSLENLKTLFNKLKEDLGPLGAAIASVGSAIGNVFKELFTYDEGSGNKLIALIKGIANAIVTLIGSLLNISSGAVEGAGTAIGDFLSRFKIPTLRELISILHDLSMALVGFALPKTIKSIGNAFDSIGKAFDGLSKKIAYKNFKMAAEGIALIAGSVFILSTIDDAALEKGLIAIGVISAIMAGMTKILSKILPSLKVGLKDLNPKAFSDSLKGYAILFLGMSAAILVIATAVKRMSDALPSKQPFETLAAILIGIAILMAEMFGMIYLLQKTKIQPTSIKDVLGYVVIIAAMVEGIKKIAETVGTLGTLGWEKVGLGTTAVTILIGGLLFIMREMGKLSSLANFNVAMFSNMIKIVSVLGISFLALAEGLKIIAGIPAEDLKQARNMLLILAGIMVAIGVLAALIPKGGGLMLLEDALNINNAKEIGKQLLIISAAMWVFAQACKAFAKADWKGFAIGIAAFASFMAILLIAGAIVHIFPGLATGMQLLSGSVKNFGIGVLALVAGLGLLLGLITTLASSLGVLSAGFTVVFTALLTAALAVMDPLMALIAELIKGVCQSIVNSTGEILKAIIQVLALLAGSAVVIGAELAFLIAAIIVGVASNIGVIIVAAFDLLIETLHGLADAIRGDIGPLIDALKDIFEAILEALGSVIESILGIFSKRLRKNVAENGGLGGGYLKGIFRNWFDVDDYREPMTELEDGLGNLLKDAGNSPELAASAEAAGTATGTTMGNAIGPAATESASTSLSDIFSNLAQNQKVSSGIQDFGLDATDIFRESIGPDSANGGFGNVANTAISDFTSGLTNDSNETLLYNSGSDVAQNTIDGIDSQDGNVYAAGSDSGQGFVNGVLSKKQASYDAGYALGLASLQGTKDATDSHSPSREFEEIGMYCDEGMANGLLKYSNLVSRSSQNIGIVALDSLSNALTNLKSMILSDPDLNPIITPVLDLSNIQNGVGLMHGMLNFAPTAGLASTIGAPYGAGSVTNYFTIYGAEGQDINELASIISEKIDASVARRDSVWA